MRKLTAAITAALMMTGCSSSPGKIIPVPEDGWTTDELAAQVYIGDKSVGFPCSLDELREQFELQDAAQLLGNTYNNRYFLRYKGESVGNVSDLDGDGKAETINLLGTDKLNNTPLAVNGVELGSTEKELSEHLGSDIRHTETDSENETIFSLSLRTEGLLLTAAGNEKTGVKMITIEGE